MINLPKDHNSGKYIADYMTVVTNFILLATEKGLLEGNMLNFKNEPYLRARSGYETIDKIDFGLVKTVIDMICSH